MATVGFIGLGIMGAPMACNLARAGHVVRGYNRTPEKATRLAVSGILPAESIAAAVHDADAVITMLPDSPDVEEVVLGDSGVFAYAQENLLYIDMSTIRPTCAAGIAKIGRARNIRVLDAPVSGGEAGAIDATLSIMVGGDPADVESARGLLTSLGSSIVHVGPAGSGQTVKAANQLLVAGNLAILAEAIVFLEANNTDMGAALMVLARGLAGSAVLDGKAKNMVERNFAPGFRLELFHKDLGIFRDAARSVGVTTVVGSLVAELVASLVARGDGELDHSCLVRIVEQLSGRSPICR